MKRLALLALLLAPCAFGQSAVLQSAQFSNGFNGATNLLSASFPKLTAGSRLIVAGESTCTAAPSVTDSNNRTYRMAINSPGSDGGVSIWDAPNTLTTPVTVTVALANCSYAAMQLIEAKGLSGVIDAVASATTTALNGSTFTVGTLTANSGDLIFAAVHDNFGFGGLSGAPGYAFLPATQSPAGAEWKVVGAGGANVVTFGAKSGYRYTGAAVAYSTGGTPPPPPPPPPPNTCTGTAGLTINGVVVPPLTLTTPVTLPQATVGQAYSANLKTIAAVSGGNPPYTFTLMAGTSLPAGLALSSAGVISGTPSVAGTSIFSYIVTDTAGSAIVVEMKMVAGRIETTIRDGNGNALDCSFENFPPTCALAGVSQ